MVFAETHRYGTPLLDVVQGGGIFTSRTLPRGSDDDQALRGLNQALLGAFGLWQEVAHTEYIKGTDGTFYFLETAARVAGANIAVCRRLACHAASAGQADELMLTYRYLTKIIGRGVGS